MNEAFGFLTAMYYKSFFGLLIAWGLLGLVAGATEDAYYTEIEIAFRNYFSKGKEYIPTKRYLKAILLILSGFFLFGPLTFSNRLRSLVYSWACRHS